MFAGLGPRHTPWQRHGTHATGALHHLPVLFVSEIPSLPPCSRARARARRSSRVERQHRASRAAKMRTRRRGTPRSRACPRPRTENRDGDGCDGRARFHLPVPRSHTFPQAAERKQGRRRSCYLRLCDSQYRPGRTTGGLRALPYHTQADRLLHIPPLALGTACPAQEPAAPPEGRAVGTLLTAFCF